ncbi:MULTISPECIES: AAA family ATPase [unclassified Candidatus Tisiphia]|uniref:AAA family ATPase n=1 Tax=unclassified Candidatus Tisiphia TaxID=2996318 RepID=UPI001E7286A7|nr:MAG: ATP-binding protein [Rickettsia endosymbiont of Cimex lectularius]
MTEKKSKNNINYQPKMLVGSDDFYDLLINSDIFVDKSLMIKELLEDSGKVILIARPRRWGKSLNMDMLKKFFEIEVDQDGKPLPLEQKINNKLFLGGTVDLGFDETKELKSLKIADIASSMKRQGQYPVISISFKDVKGSSYQDIENGIRNQVIKLFVKHRYLKHYIAKNKNLLDDVQKEQLKRYFTGEFNKDDLKDSLGFLSELLFKHFNQKVYILIDEYDTPINNAYLELGHKTKEFDQILKLFRGILGSSLKTNPYLEKGVITGILRIAKANLFSDLNNVTEYTLLDKKFAKFYGFTQAEVDELLTVVPTKTNPEEIQNWYNGYTFGGEIIYNPWSIMQCLAREGELDHYWLDSGGTSIIDKVFVSDEIQEDLTKLLEGEGIVRKLYKQISLEEIEDNQNIFYSLLLFTGYLNATLANDNKEDPRYCLTIPNKEVRNIYVERVIKWLTKKLTIKMNEYDNFIGLLITEQISEFGERLQEYLLRSTSYHDLTEEKDYHNLIGGLLAPLVSQYMIESNKETGYGRCDHILIPIAGLRDNALIIEYKIAKPAENLESIAKTGLKQIIDKQYDAKVKGHKHVKKIVKISIAFCGKKVVLKYQID